MLVALIAVVAAALSTVGLAVASGAFRSGGDAPNGSCSAPQLPGTVVDVRLMNMGGRTPMMGGAMGGMMRVVADRQTVPAGTMSFRVANVGSIVHELVVLPLEPGASAGDRTAGSDNRVDESSSAGRSLAKLRQRSRRRDRPRRDRVGDPQPAGRRLRTGVQPSRPLRRRHVHNTRGALTRLRRRFIGVGAQVVPSSWRTTLISGVGGGGGGGI